MLVGMCWTEYKVLMAVFYVLWEYCWLLINMIHIVGYN